MTMDTAPTPRHGLLIILSSPSGAGKSTLARRLRAWDPTLSFSVSATTRAPRPGEIDGEHYRFLDEAAFESMIRDGRMLEHARVFGNLYGSPMAPVVAATDAGRDVLFDIDWQGAQQIRDSALGKHTLSIFILPPSIPELKRRLETRAQDHDEVIADRMRKSWDEISQWDVYDYVLVNADVEATERNLKTIVRAERMRRERQPGLQAHVRRLQAEFEELMR